MKSMLKRCGVRKAIVVLCSAGLAVGVAVAQQDAPPPPADGQQQGPPPPPNGQMKMNPDHRAEMMQRRLNLTPGQTAQVRTILADDMGKMDALRANAAVAAQDRRAQMETIRKHMQMKIRGVLTPEQQATFDTMQADMRAKERERRSQAMDGGAGAPPPPPPPASPQQ